ncbi:Down syndrome cell adhesion molecule-like protein Dscam2, partial [Araneus ventricosus]
MVGSTKVARRISRKPRRR